MTVKIVTDSSCDLGINFITENNVELIPLILNLDGKVIEDDLGKSLTYKEFYCKLREGSMPSTSQINSYTFEEKFNELLNKGDEVLYIGLSSALSGTFNSANIAKNNILEENPNAKIAIVDSLSVSMGVGLLVKKACQMAKDNCSLEEIVQWVEENKNKIIHSIVVEDLNHLKRGGRISSSVAAIGSLLNIKPILEIDENGALIPKEKVKGKKKALKYLTTIIKERISSIEGDTLYIMHGDSLEEAEKLKELILEEIPNINVEINYIGTVVGAHAGPGTMAVVFLGNNR